MVSKWKLISKETFPPKGMAVYTNGSYVWTGYYLLSNKEDEFYPGYRFKVYGSDPSLDAWDPTPIGWMYLWEMLDEKAMKKLKNYLKKEGYYQNK